MVIGWCNILETEYPKRFSAALLTKRMLLCSSMVMMASVAVSAIRRKSWAGWAEALVERTGIAVLELRRFGMTVAMPNPCLPKGAAAGVRRFPFDQDKYGQVQM
jgi:hypothetical protein